jgi:Bacteriophage related domain of unknown function
MASLKSIKAALEARLVAIASPLPTQWENVVFTPPADGSAYQAADLLPASPDNPTLGDGFYRELGLFQVMLSYPLNGGSGPVYAKAEAIRDWFPRGLSLTSGGITVKVERTPAIGPKRVVQDRFTLPITVRYYADVFS